MKRVIKTMFKALLFSLKTLLFISFSLVVASDNKCLRVADAYPKAQVWFNRMAQKYPQAHLENVVFYVSNENLYYSGNKAIFFPTDCLININNLFKDYSTEQFDEQAVAVLSEAEYILLHEAGHIIHQDQKRIALAAVATILTLAGINSLALYSTLSEQISPSTGIIASIASSLALIASFYNYMPLLEQQADNFANQQADNQALLSGLQWFVNLHTQKHGFQTQKLNSVFVTISDMLDDHEHPSAIYRANQVLRQLLHKNIFKIS